MKLLIVEDNEDLNNMLALFFSENNFQVFQAVDKSQGLRFFYDKNPDIVVLDLNLPDGNGLEICREIKAVSEVPVIILTANSTSEDEILGLKSGADDYIAKPFNLEILFLRIKALMGRRNKDEIFLSTSLRVIPKEYRVLVDGTPVNISPKEYDLLLFLWENRGAFISREKIINHIWGFDYYGSMRTVDTHINRLKKKIEAGNITIESKRGRGYRLTDED